MTDTSHKYFPPSIDVVALVFVFMALLMGGADSTVDWLLPYLLPMLGAYVLLDLLSYGPSFGLFRARCSRRLSTTLKQTIVWLLIALFVVVPTLFLILGRHATQPHLFVHDGLIQTEEAMKLVLDGHNPYVEDYVDTALADWDFRERGLTENPTLYHIAYLPATFTLPIPFYLIANWVLGWYDHRIFHLVALFGLLMLLPSLADSSEHKLSLLLLVGLNPLFVPFFIEGRNDVLMLFWLVASSVLLRKGRYTGAAITLGLACSTKQTAWFFLPFFLFYLATGITHMEKAQAVLRRALPLVLVMVAFLAPFLLWNFQAFIDDTLRFVSGGIATAFPIAGIGFGAVVLQAGWVAANTAWFPFSLFQLGVGLPILALLLWMQRKINTLSWIWLAYAVLTGAVSYFSRVFVANYMGIILIALLIAYFAGDKSRSSPRAQKEGGLGALNVGAGL